MNLKIKKVLAHPFFHDYKALMGVWLFLAIITSILKINKCNNFLVFKGSFFHAMQGLNLYDEYPLEYFDLYHYGPLFSLFVCPFAVLPHPLGLFMWMLFLTIVLYFSIYCLSLPKQKKIFIYWFCAQELLTALCMCQFNIVVAATLLICFFCVEKKHDEYATFVIVFGTLIKLYSIVGIVFFIFSKRKIKFLLSLIFWSFILVTLPMFFWGYDYIASQYAEWFYDLITKNEKNAIELYQNVSLLGMIHRITGCQFSNLYLIMPGLLLAAIPCLRFKQYKSLSFRYAMLSSMLLFVVLFSTGSESSSYIIALIGVSLWYLTSPWKRNNYDLCLLIFVFFLTSISASEIFPAILRRQFVRPYSLKALPCVIVWLKLCYEMIFRDYVEEKPKT